MARSVLISISPNTNASDIFLAFKTILNPFKWLKGESQTSLKQKILSLYQSKDCFLFNAGRNALLLALKSLSLKSSDEVICQAFTCVAVPNAIKWAGANPIFVDTDPDNPNMSLKDLTHKISPRTKAVIVQHNFGHPDKIIKIKYLCHQHNLILIEDCAHTVGVKYNQRLLGTFGDLTILSFGRDKAISSVFGGALLINNSLYLSKISELYQKLNYPSPWFVFKQLLHPLVTSLIIPTYFYFGKYLMFIYQQSGFLSWPVSKKEKQGQSWLLPQKLPNALARLALHQLYKISDLNMHRLKLTRYYQKHFKVENLKPYPLIRFPLRVNKPKKLIAKAKKNHILLGNWYRPVIAPSGVNYRKINYHKGQCPDAEKISQSIVNLPTHPKVTLKQAQLIVNICKNQ